MSADLGVFRGYEFRDYQAETQTIRTTEKRFKNGHKQAGLRYLIWSGGQDPQHRRLGLRLTLQTAGS